MVTYELRNKKLIERKQTVKEEYYDREDLERLVAYHEASVQKYTGLLAQLDKLEGKTTPAPEPEPTV